MEALTYFFHAHVLLRAHVLRILRKDFKRNRNIFLSNRIAILVIDGTNSFGGGTNCIHHQLVKNHQHIFRQFVLSYMKAKCGEGRGSFSEYFKLHKNMFTISTYVYKFPKFSNVSQIQQKFCECLPTCSERLPNIFRSEDFIRRFTKSLSVHHLG